MTLSEQLEIVNQFRDTAPVDVSALAERIGVPVFVKPLPKNISGMITRTPSGYEITVNATDVPTRRRFTIAHELGHYLLHRELIGNGIDDDRGYRSAVSGSYNNTKIGTREETEANKFASNLLMPDHLIERLRTEGVTTPEALASALDVSVKAMRVRLGLPTFTA
jgi:Zn-dependent peptidase ImmA (M78 family)